MIWWVHVAEGVNMKDQPARGANKNEFTRGMMDFQYDLPSSNMHIGCAAKCGDTTYPEPKPVDQGLTPEQPTA